MKRIKSIALQTLILTSLLCLAPISFKPAKAEDSLVIGIHPYLSQGELTERFTPLAKYVGNEIGRDIKIRVGSSYDEHIEYIGNNKIDIAYMGPASYINMTQQYGEKPVLARLEINGNPWFQGCIVAQKNSGIKTIQDLKNKRIAYGDPNSTMSFIVPHYMLMMAGVYTSNSPKYQFLGTHTNVALGVLSGDFDAGAIKPEVFNQYEDKGLIKIAVTPKISEHLFVTRSMLSPELVDNIRHTLLSLHQSEEGRHALQSIKKSISRLVEASHGDYENLNTIIAESRKFK